MQEKSNKKVSRACNTCRLKRKKCDGLEPCFFCTENKLECSYSREPRRRGPPSGYLRYTETRVVLLETLLGLYISRSFGHASDPFLDTAKTLLLESKTCTQDIWDGHKILWTASASSKVVEDLAMFFAPFHRTENEQPSRPLLPPVNNNLKPNSSPSSGANPISAPPPLNHPSIWPHPHRAGSPRLHSNSLSFHTQPSHIMSRESFERTQNVPPPFTSSTIAPTGERSESQQWSPNPSHRGLSNIDFEMPEDNNLTSQVHDSYTSSTSQADYGNGNEQISPDVDSPMIEIDQEVNRETLITNTDREGVYTGSYWRTAELESTSSPKTRFFDAPIRNGIELPPPHVLKNLLDVYYQHVHPSFPFLPPRSSLENQIQGSLPSKNAVGLNTMLLALCAYSGRLSPSLDSTTTNILSGAGEAGKVAADLWYEQSRTAVSAEMRKGSSIETAQALLLLALRDHGRGFESQAWLLVGLAVRMAQDLGLNEDEKNKVGISPEDVQTQRNIWDVSIILDLFLSLQLGRPPATMDALRAKNPSDSSRWESNIGSSSLIPEVSSISRPQSLFVHTISLCQIIARINFYFYLGFNSPEIQSQTEKFLELKAELDMWQHNLPHTFRISIGHQPEREVLEVNMLYHVAIILLHRPLSLKDKSMQQAAEVFLEAASTFNVLLEKYRQSQSFSLSPNPSLNFSNPNMIYLIFTVSIAHLSGYKLRQRQQTQSNHTGLNRSATMALQTQLHLLNCLEALTSIGNTWDLARRCWRTLDKLMDMEGMKPKSATESGGVIGLGKRKRDREGEDTELHGSPRSPPTINHCWIEQERAVNNSPMDSVGSFSQGGINHPQLMTGWNTKSTDPINPPTPLPVPVPSESFDLNVFASARWLPEVLSVSEAVPSGLETVWDGEWDEGFWAQSLHFGLDEGG